MNVLTAVGFVLSIAAMLFVVLPVIEHRIDDEQQNLR